VDHDSVVEELVKREGWSYRTARAFVRANCRCEYCGFDLLASIEALKLLEVDHIDPTLKGEAREDLSNIAISCRHCNTHLKRSWNPRKTAAPGLGREGLIEHVKRRLDEIRRARVEALARHRKIVGYKERDA
jgi:hypothetical protein